MQIGKFFIAFFFLYSQVAFSQELLTSVIDPDCDSNGKITVSLSNGDGTEMFFITSGPVCSAGSCPLSDNPYGRFQSLPAGTYVISAFNSIGQFIASAETSLEGMYSEPEAFAESVPSLCGANGQINITEITNGNDPFIFRVFPGTVSDYCTVIGPKEKVLAFQDTDSFDGLFPDSDLMVEDNCNPNNTPNPIPGLWTYQIKDDCNVIRSKTVFIDEALEFMNPIFKLNCIDGINCNSAITDIHVSSELFSNTSFSLNRILTNPNYAELQMLLPITIVQQMGNDAPRILDVLDIDDPIGDFYPLTHQCGDEITLSLEYTCFGNDFIVPSTTMIKECFPPIQFASYIIGCSDDLDSVMYKLGENKIIGDLLFMVCKDELHVTVEDINTGEILYDDDLSNKAKMEWIFSAHNEVIFLYTNLCSDTESSWTPVIPTPNRNFVYSNDFVVKCDDELLIDMDINNGFAEGVDDIIVIDAPLGYAFALPHSLGKMGSTSGPTGTYCYEIVSECKTIIQCIETPTDVSYDLQYSGQQACLSHIYDWTLDLPNPDLAGDFLIRLYLDDGKLIDTKNIRTSGSQVRFTIDAQYCNREIRFEVRTQGELCFEVTEMLACYEFPAGAELLPFICPNMNCNVETVNVIVSSPLRGGQGPYTFWLFKEDESIACCDPIQEIISADPQGTFTGVCSEELPLDIYITDNCGQQIFYQVSFGAADLGIIIETDFEVCEVDTIDLSLALPGLAATGYFEGVDNAPQLDSNIFRANRDQVDQCYSYRFILPEDTFVGQCGAIVDSVEICVISCNPIFESSISGNVFEDLNNDDLQDLFDIRVENVNVALYQEGGILISETITDVNGEYQFNDLGRGKYYVIFELLDGYQFVNYLAGNDAINSDVEHLFAIGSTRLITLAETEMLENIDAGIRCRPSPIFDQENQDGMYSCNEVPIFIQPAINYFCVLTGSGSFQGFALACGPAIVSFEDEATGITCAGEIITRTWTASDDCGNLTTAQQTMSATDDIAPLIILSNAQLEYACGSDPIFDTPETNDNCSEVNLSFTDEILDGACGSQNIKRIWLATDECGNTSTVEALAIGIDHVPPIITGLGLNAEFNCDSIPEFDTPIATDDCGEATLSFEDVMLTNICGMDAIKRVWTATDECGNSSTGEQVLTAVDFVVPEIIGVMPDGEYLCGNLPIFSDPVATDNCGEVQLGFEDLMQDNGCLGISIQRIWTATDECGNLATASQIMTSVDLEAPVITSLIMDSIYNCIEGPLFTEISAIDNCGTVSIDFMQEGSMTACGFDNLRRIWIVSDNCGNTTTVSQMLRYEDNTPPVIIGVDPDVNYNCGSSAQFSNPQIMDECGVATLSFIDQLNDDNCGGQSITRTWTATDQCGNTSSANQTLSEMDLEAPIFGDNEDLVNFDCSQMANIPDPELSDLCTEITLSFMDEIGNALCGGDQVIRTWIATDACGNSSSYIQTFDSNDDESPIISGIADDGEYTCDLDPLFSDPMVEDNCTIPNLTFIDVAGMEGCMTESVTRIWTATDACGNSSTASQKFVLIDVLPPNINGVGQDQTYPCNQIPEFGGQIYISEAKLDFEACLSFADHESSADYSEFVPVLNNDPQGPEISIGMEHLYRINPEINRHSCAPGLNETIAMCVDYLQECDYEAGNQKSVIVEVNLKPNLSLDNRLHSFSFYEKAPDVFSFLNGPTGPSNNPTFYGIRILRDGLEIFREIDIVTSLNWSHEKFNFTGNDDFSFNVETKFTFELMAYCPNDNGAMMGVWDLDDMLIKAVAEDLSMVATDECGLDNFTFKDEIVDSNCSGVSITRTWTAIDFCGNVATDSQTYFPIDDITAPIIVGVQADTTFACGSFPKFSFPYGLDECSDVIIDFEDKVNGQVMTRTWTATDGCGNTSTASQSTQEDCSSKMFALFPNPASNKTQLQISDEFGSQEITELSIFSFDGNKLSESLVHTNEDQKQIDINLEAFQDGIYLIRFKIANRFFTKRLVIVK